MGRLFGTDGIRGVANIEPMTAETALQVGRAIAYFCRRPDASRKPRVVIGKDTRISGYMLENALTAGCSSMGADVFLVGPMPTPGIAFITKSMRAEAGIVISASHNPYEDNGIKIFGRSGYKLPDEMEASIESWVAGQRVTAAQPTAHEIGKAKRIDDAIGRYIVFCKNTFPDEWTLDGMKLVMDCANGATYKVAPIIFNELGAEVESLHVEPDGFNINERCGSQHPGDVARRVREKGAAAGLAFDGDGDRLIMVDERGQVLSGDHILAICAQYYRARGWLKRDMAISTVMCNFGLRETFARLRCRLELADVGDRQVLMKMMETGAVLGGESSGHMIFHNHHTTGDGIVTALQVLAAMNQAGAPLSELAAIMHLYPQTLLNVVVASKPSLGECAATHAAIQAAEAELGGKGRVLVRYSGTQALCRVMVEGPEEDAVQRMAAAIAAAVQEELGGDLPAGGPAGA